MSVRCFEFAFCIGVAARTQALIRSAFENHFVMIVFLLDQLVQMLNRITTLLKIRLLNGDWVLYALYHNLIFEGLTEQAFGVRVLQFAAHKAHRVLQYTIKFLNLLLQILAGEYPTFCLI